MMRAVQQFTYAASKLRPRMAARRLPVNMVTSKTPYFG
jgi:hypothetical protein